VSLADGAAAMVAYQRLQFVEMPDQERKDIEAASCGTASSTRCDGDDLGALASLMKA